MVSMKRSSYQTYRVSHNWVFTLFLLFCWLLLILISKVGIVLENSGNLLHDRHKNFENRFRNGLDNWGQSCHPSFWYLKFVITQRQQNDFHVKVGNFDLNYLSHFWIDFQNLCAYHVANVLNLSKLPQLLQSGWVEAGKITETKWILNCGTPCIYKFQLFKYHKSWRWGRSGRCEPPCHRTPPPTDPHHMVSCRISGYKSASCCQSLQWA